ncbi:MAG: hypothetical protein IKZ16_07020 [Clostridia bacterium]|nr:hypothetical protein [Clostridia bacterium]
MKRFLQCTCLVLLLVLTLGLLISCGDKTELEQSMVTSVEIDKKATQIRVKAGLTEGDLETYRDNSIYNQKLYLMALEPGETTADLAGKQPVAECSMSTSPKFTFSLYGEGNMQAHSRLHCAFAVAVYNKTLSSYVMLTSPVYVSNVADVAENDTAFPKAASIKGLHASIATDAAYLGVSHAVVELDPSVLILDAKTDTSVSYVWDGQTYYLDRAALDELDMQVSEYCAQGATVYLRLMMRTAPDKANSLVSCLYAEGAGAKNVRAYAIWMDDDKSASLMAGFLDFITARYTSPEGEHGFCGALIIGRSVNESTKNNNAGAVQIEDYVSRYHALVRLAHSTLKSHYAEGRVYLSVSNNLTASSALENSIGWTTNRFLNEFRVLSAAGGNFDWNVSISAYATDERSNTLWTDPHTDSMYLSPTNVDDFNLLLQEQFFYNGQRRHLIIGDFEIALGDSPENQAASYAYAYYKVLGNGTVDALIYSAHTDKQSLISGSGLWSTDKNNNAADRRVLYEVFKSIDTKDNSELSKLGISSLILDWSSLYEAQSSRAATRHFINGKDVGQNGKPSGKSHALFSFTGGSLHSFTPGSGTEYLELTKDQTLGWPVLCAQLERTQPSAFMGISNATLQGSDLKGIKALAINVCADVDTTEPIYLKLRLVKQGSGTLSAGNGQIVYEKVVDTLTPNQWSTVYFDVSEFTALVGGNDAITVSVQLKVPSLDENGDCTLMLDRIQAYGNTGVQFYEWIIIVVCVLTVLALLAGLVYLLYRKYGAPPIIANIFWNASGGKIKLRRYKKTTR